MIVYDFPEQARSESAAFSVVGREQQSGDLMGELQLVPAGTGPDKSFSGPIFYLDPGFSPDKLPISQTTLVAIPWAESFPQNPVYFSSEDTHAPLAERLRAGMDAFGSRVWLVIRPLCDLYRLPGDLPGKVISRAESAILRSEYESADAAPFLCRYLVYLRQTAMLHLYDTPQTIRDKVALAASLGIENCLII